MGSPQPKVAAWPSGSAPRSVPPRGPREKQLSQTAAEDGTRDSRPPAAPRVSGWSLLA